MVQDDNNHAAIEAAIVAGAHKAAEETAQGMVTAIDDGFESGRDALGRPWAPLQPETISRKGNSRILIEENDLRESWQYRMTGVASATVFSDDPKAWYHELGVPGNNLPARPMLAPAVALAEQDLLTTSLDTVLGDALDNAGRL